MKREYMVCLNCVYQDSGCCCLNPYHQNIANSLEQDLRYHFCGQGAWKEKFDHIELYHTRKWGEWSDSDDQPHIQSYADTLIERAEEYKRRKHGQDVGPKKEIA